LSVSTFGFRSPDSLRISALAYGALVAAAGTALHRRRIKAHFLESYLHVAVRHLDTDTATFGYFVVTGALVIIVLVVLARQFGRDE
jgi:hypothetical protein